MLPDKPVGQSNTIKGAAFAAILTALVNLLPLIGISFASPISQAIIAVLYAISALLMVIGVRGILGEIAVWIKAWVEGRDKK
jgi:hypothetical protein